MLFACCAPVWAQSSDYQPLFDGETLDGWEGPENLFRVQNGTIIAGTLEASIPNNAFLCTTEQYDSFELRLLGKLIGEGDNAGVQFRSERVPNHHEVSGFQADMGSVSRAWLYQVIGRGSPEAGEPATAPVWGALYDETRRDRFLAWGDLEEVERLVKPSDWNELIVRAQGAHIQVWLNGQQTVDYTEVSHIPHSGVICLQIHSGPPAEAWYKDIGLKRLQD